MKSLITLILFCSLLAFSPLHAEQTFAISGFFRLNTTTDEHRTSGISGQFRLNTTLDEHQISGISNLFRVNTTLDEHRQSGSSALFSINTTVEVFVVSNTNPEITLPFIGLE